MYTPWVNAMSVAFTRIEWSKDISNLSEVWILKKKKKKKKIADSGTPTLALLLYWPTRRPVVLPLRYFGTCWYKLKQNINKVCSDTWLNVYSPPRFYELLIYFLFRFCVWCEAVPACGIFQNIDGLDFKMDLLAFWAVLPFISRIISRLFISRILKKIFFGLIIS